MDITYLSVMKGSGHQFADSKKIISDCVNAFAGQAVQIKNFSSPKRMLVAASQALRSTDVVIIAVQTAMFNTVKKLICTSLDLDPEQKNEVYDALYPLYDKGAISESALAGHSVFPADANIFATPDFRYCGFSVVAGAQSIVVLPLDPIRTAETVFGSLYTFLADFGGIANNEDVVKCKRAAMMIRIVSLLKQSDSKLVFLPLGCKKLIEENMEIADKEHKFISFFQKIEPRKTNQPAMEYIVSVTQQARVDSQSDYACAVSGAFASNRDDTVFVLYAAADENNTAAARIFANKGESPKEISSAAFENALISAGSKIMKNILEEASRNNKPDKIFRRKLAAISAAAAVGSALIGTVAAMLIK